jgi:hypothetical protein
MTNLKSIEGDKEDGPAATVEQLAALEFKGVRELARMPEKEQEQHVRDQCNDVYKMGIVALGILAQNKKSLVKMVSEHHDTVGPWLMGLHHAATDIKRFAEAIQSAEIRMAVALAIVEGDEPPDDDGGGRSADDGEIVSAA